MNTLPHVSKTLNFIPVLEFIVWPLTSVWHVWSRFWSTLSSGRVEPFDSNDFPDSIRVIFSSQRISGTRKGVGKGKGEGAGGGFFNLKYISYNQNLTFKVSKNMNLIYSLNMSQNPPFANMVCYAWESAPMTQGQHPLLSKNPSLASGPHTKVQPLSQPGIFHTPPSPHTHITPMHCILSLWR